MFIQGDLQAVFDALYTMGVIDPVLKEDWQKLSGELAKSPGQYQQAVAQINSCSGNKDEIIQKLSGFDRKVINYVAVEVARELADFADRKTLH